MSDGRPLAISREVLVIFVGLPVFPPIMYIVSPGNLPQLLPPRHVPQTFPVHRDKRLSGGGPIACEEVAYRRTATVTALTVLVLVGMLIGPTAFGTVGVEVPDVIEVA